MLLGAKYGAHIKQKKGFASLKCIYNEIKSAWSPSYMQILKY